MSQAGKRRKSPEECKKAAASSLTAPEDVMREVPDQLSQQDLIQLNLEAKQKREESRLFVYIPQ